MEGITHEELEDRIREILSYGIVRYNWPHLKERMDERNYDMGDIRHILRKGKILEFEEEGNGKYRCKVRGEDLEGDKGTVIVSVIKNKKLVIVTVLGGV